MSIRTKIATAIAAVMLTVAVARQNMVIVLVGDRGTGKTTWLKKRITSYLKNGMKVLIIDTIDHVSYREYPVIPIEKLKHWTGGVGRLIIPPHRFNEAMHWVKKYVWNALVVVEDAYKVVKRKLPDDTAAAIIDTKQQNVDMIFMYHTWGWAVKDLLTIADAFQIFKTEDSPMVRKDGISGSITRVMAAWEKVMASSNQFETKSVLK